MSVNLGPTRRDWVHAALTWGLPRLDRFAPVCEAPWCDAPATTFRRGPVSARLWLTCDWHAT